MNNKILALSQTFDILIQRALKDGVPEAAIEAVMQNKLYGVQTLVNQAVQKEANMADEVGDPVIEEIQHPEDL